MDPDANLKEQLALAAKIDAGIANIDAFCDVADRLAELVLALDQWLARGGFRPGWWHQ